MTVLTKLSKQLTKQLSKKQDLQFNVANGNMSITNGLLNNFAILKDLKILVVDNSSDSRYLCSVLFESYFAKVVAAETIKDALVLLNGFIPDLLICEIRFLGESVSPLIERVRHIAQGNYKTIPVLVTSTCSSMEIIQYLAVPIEAYLRKPIDIEDFIEVILRLKYLSSITNLH
jgi:CheY-like chemotaxis protein